METPKEGVGDTTAPAPNDAETGTTPSKTRGQRDDNTDDSQTIATEDIAAECDINKLLQATEDELPQNMGERVTEELSANPATIGNSITVANTGNKAHSVLSPQ